jgi:hypothetical protein
VSADWMITPRARDLSRPYDPISRWTKLVLAERCTVPDQWVLTGPASELGVFEAGMGCILDRDGEYVTSGKLWSYDRVGEYDNETRRPIETMTLAFISDNAALSRRAIYQVPTKILTGNPSKFALEHDVRSGAREDLILEYINANLGPGAQAQRRLPKLVLPVSLHRGGTTQFTARMNDLAAVVRDLAEAAGLRVRIVHDESTGTPRLVLTLEPMVDVSSDVWFGLPSSSAPAFINSWKFHYEEPQVTDAIVAAGGEALEREYAAFRDTAAVNLWGDSKEKVIDQRQTKDPTEITTAGNTALAEGATPVAVEFTIADSVDVQVRRDFGVGHRVGVELDGLPEGLADNVVRELQTTVENAGGSPVETVKAVVGTVGASVTSTQAALNLTRALRGLHALERSY